MFSLTKKIKKLKSKTEQDDLTEERRKTTRAETSSKAEGFRSQAAKEAPIPLPSSIDVRDFPPETVSSSSQTDRKPFHDRWIACEISVGAQAPRSKCHLGVQVTHATNLDGLIFDTEMEGLIRERWKYKKYGGTTPFQTLSDSAKSTIRRYVEGKTKLEYRPGNGGFGIRAWNSIHGTANYWIYEHGRETAEGSAEGGEGAKLQSASGYEAA